MNDFDYEAMQKKRIAAGAYHKKNGSKSKKCTLPSDHLTDAQKRKLNGPLYTVNLNQPMSWEDFKGLTDTLKREYLEGLMANYRASMKMLGRMFGVQSVTVSREMKRLGVKPLPTDHSVRGESFARKQAMWAAFCNGVVGGGDDPNLVKPEANEQIEAQDERIEEPHVWDLDSEAEAVARAQERLESIEAQGVSLHSEDGNIAGIERHEPECGETEAEEAKPRINLTALAAKYEDDADAVYAQIGELMQMFSGAKVKVKLSVEVCGWTGRPF